MFIYYLVIFMLTVQSGIIDCEELSESTQQIIQSYQNSIDASVTVDKTDSDLVNVWLEDFQMKQVNLITKYRVQMIMHKDNNFERSKLNFKWQKCLLFLRRQIRNSQHGYEEKENECLRTAMVSEKKKESVEQMRKEIRKWRKGYRYLNNLCKTNNSGDDTAAKYCLVDYIQKNKFHETLQGLFLLKEEAMRKLLQDLNNSTSDLEKCLQICLSEYLSAVRTVRGVLGKCYNGKEDGTTK